MSAISSVVVEDLEQAKDVWNALSPHESLYDEWEFRRLFYNPAKSALRFIVAKDSSNKPIALLPLQQSTIQGSLTLEFFGGQFMECNRLFTHPMHSELSLEDFLSVLPGNYWLDYIIPMDEFTKNLPLDDYAYSLPIAGYTNVADFFAKKIDSDSIRQAIRKLLLHPFTFREGTFEDLSPMVLLLEKQFGTESLFAEPAYLAALRTLLEGDIPCDFRVLCSGGVPVSFAFSVLYAGCYYFLATATDRSAYKDIGKLIIYHVIDRAISKGCSHVEAAAGDCGWKERWEFERIPLHEYKSGVPSQEEGRE
ncbi:hypothetical protein COU78_01345 [Candidatus Peregrinibacteria bacterium CG10_big_fil_rev_8_21_14_0_10_49_24]|nr:MAG: hypothetical protein COV83_04310 [Candidatus Peregrinibacteria bacterium CG11_big_fil_rev_8_21_14_0_20_49_14]PIR51370.1 MAG: hypothetical protein COU78_01345 [Candidatus Peregrinibacteria bacterium CG10_big_fil_rev_8_21_14_0_10_49_24]PJA68134.1 MAG: hypothetical protein CO157_01160 [Candidatus Peregrinibacteria bacterium CG_4_9_14_3_um_filter_49_12]